MSRIVRLTPALLAGRSPSQWERERARRVFIGPGSRWESVFGRTEAGVGLYKKYILNDPFLMSALETMGATELGCTSCYPSRCCRHCPGKAIIALQQALNR